MSALPTRQEVPAADPKSYSLGILAERNLSEGEVCLLIHTEGRLQVVCEGFTIECATGHEALEAFYHPYAYRLKED